MKIFALGLAIFIASPLLNASAFPVNLFEQGFYRAFIVRENSLVVRVEIRTIDDQIKTEFTNCVTVGNDDDLMLTCHGDGETAQLSHDGLFVWTYGLDSEIFLADHSVTTADITRECFRQVTPYSMIIKQGEQGFSVDVEAFGWMDAFDQCEGGFHHDVANDLVFNLSCVSSEGKEVLIHGTASAGQTMMPLIATWVTGNVHDPDNLFRGMVDVRGQL